VRDFSFSEVRVNNVSVILVMHDMHWALVGSIYVYLLVFLQAMLLLTDISVMKIRACGEEDETLVHFVGKCPATIMARHSILGYHFLRLDELRCIQPHALMRFARASKRFK